ncbi:hypothetical protein J2S14_003739 [Lederbergia wuyishanensis]|uniref:Uncharacterized protein n=1 Tax=Lederbergia wuyishanensis TaxID=1347903 RepID=A0ABU0D900_9BACI|nr:hypothetical protein [Lederbergia wuyishanensis]
MEEMDPLKAVAFATAGAALKHTIYGDANHFYSR